jgi:hypothetical protein
MRRWRAASGAVASSLVVTHSMVSRMACDTHLPGVTRDVAATLAGRISRIVAEVP